MLKGTTVGTRTLSGNRKRALTWRVRPRRFHKPRAGTCHVGLPNGRPLGKCLSLWSSSSQRQKQSHLAGLVGLAAWRSGRPGRPGSLWHIYVCAKWTQGRYFPGGLPNGRPLGKYLSLWSSSSQRQRHLIRLVESRRQAGKAGQACQAGQAGQVGQAGQPRQPSQASQANQACHPSKQASQASQTRQLSLYC